MAFTEASLATNLLNPATLSFCLGAFARFVKSELVIPKDVYAGISLFLLFAIGLKGGYELSEVSMAAFWGPASVTLILGIVTPLIAYTVGRRLGRLSVVDSAAIAAHYGSVSAVTFIAAQGFVTEMVSQRPDLQPLEGYLPTLVALLESPGITIALLLGVLLGNSSSERSKLSLIHEVLTGKTLFLLLGGLVIGSMIGEQHWGGIAPLFDPKGGIFRGLLCIFLLEMGISAASRLGEIRKAGVAMVAMGVGLPLINAAIGVSLGYLSGLSVGGTAVLATMAASASYIAAPTAVQATLPSANPAYYLTLALAITFPFNIVIGIPLYFSMTEWFFKTMM